MKSKRIGRRSPLRKRTLPGNLLRCRNDFGRRNRQRRHVQRLTNMASGLRTAGMMVQKRAAAGEIEQCQASKNGQEAP